MANDIVAPEDTSAILILLFVVIVLTLFRIILSCQEQPLDAPATGLRREEASQEAQIALPMMIPAACTYKEAAGVVMGEDKTCSVCLCEFKEGEEVRVLPECLHSFHVPCIDAWLSSHASCPLCRTGIVAAPTPELPVDSAELRIGVLGA